MKRKASPDSPSQADVRTAVDARAAELQAQVEELASMEACDGLAPPMLLDEIGRNGEPPQDGKFPMLIRSTDTGIYLKFAVLLQDQLVRMRGTVDALREENDSLRRQLDLQASTQPASTTLQGGFALSASRNDSVVSDARTEINEPSSAKEPRREAAASDAKPASKASSLDITQVDATPSSAAALATESAADGAAALITLSSPRITPNSVGSCASAPAEPPKALDMWNMRTHRPPPVAPPPAPAPAHAPAGACSVYPSFRNAALQPGCGPALPGRSPALPGRSPLITDSPSVGLGRLTDQDEMLADLLCSPTMNSALGSPRLASMLGHYLDGSGRRLPPTPGGSSLAAATAALDERSAQRTLHGTRDLQQQQQLAPRAKVPFEGLRPVGFLSGPTLLQCPGPAPAAPPQFRRAAGTWQTPPLV